ncbi:phosphatase PAP2 family protein [Polymorphospora sp. NPDC050346]|uniref:phosphatase PAP2 family protein n=1 Tax=Polymorphospora sp. NPDC050346 TaxID=3155780 RepID=UPI00340253EC
MSVTTVASVGLALVAVAVAFATVVAARPTARRLRGMELARHVPAWARDRVPPGPFVLVAGAVLALALVSVFVEILDAVVEEDDFTAFDRPVVEWVAQHRTGWSSAVVVAVTDIGGKALLTLLLAGVAVAVAVRLRSWRPFVLAAVSGGGSALLVAGSKLLIARDRPDPLHRAVVESGFSFPSGHSASALVILATVAWLISMATGSRTVRATAWVAAGILAVAIGVSRVYLGVHYPSDVVAGWMLGATWLVTVAVADRLPGSPPLPLPYRWRGADGSPGWLAHRPVAVFTVTATAGFAAIFGIVSVAALGG